MRKPNYTLGVAPEQVAKKVILTADPETCIYVAETYMKGYTPFNVNRNFPGYTGTYMTKPVTVISAGIGMGQMGLLTEELFEKYGVESVVYVSTCDALKESVKPQDYVLALSASTDSSYPDLLGLPGAVSPTADFELTVRIAEKFKEKKELATSNDNAALYVSPVLSTDRRITDGLEAEEWTESGAVAADMATAALFLNARKAGAKAAALLLVDRNVQTGEEMPDIEYRYKPWQFSCMRQIVLALENV